MAGNTLDDLLRAADKGVPIGTTQRYFKNAPPIPAPAPQTAPPPSPTAPAESEKDMIDRILGRKRQTMSDAPGARAAGQQYAKHEQSETVERDGQWWNVYGRNLPKAGQVLPGERPYKTVEEAVAAAKKRSNEHVELPPTKKGSPDRLETLDNVRRMYPEYKDIDDITLGNALAAKYKEYDFLKVDVPEGKGPPDRFDTRTPEQRMVGNVLNPGQPKPLNMAQKIGNTVLPPLATAPMIAAGGELLPAAPAIGRALTSGALGGAKAASEGKGLGGIAWDTVVDTLLGGVTEGAGKVAGAVKIPKLGWTSSLSEKAGKVAGAAAGREGGGKALDAAQDLIANRIPAKARFMIPAINPKTPLSLQDAVAALKKLDDPQYTMAKDQLIAALNEAERTMFKQGLRVPGGPPVVKPFAGSVFGKSAPTERFTYRGTPAERRLGAASRAVPGVMAGAQSAATAESVPGIPNAVLPILPYLEGTTFGDLARHVRH